MENPALIDIDLQGQLQPFFYFKEMVLTSYRQFISILNPYGFGYLLRAITMNYNNVGAAAHKNPVVSVEFFDAVGTISRQDKPVPFNLLTSPVGNINTVVAAVVVPCNLRGVRTTRKFLNYYWCYGDTVQVQITGQQLTDLNNIALQVLLEGYFVPEEPGV